MRLTASSNWARDSLKSVAFGMVRLEVVGHTPFYVLKLQESQIRIESLFLPIS